MFIAVVGGSNCSEEEASLAEEVGRELARQGATLVCGGLGGVMQAACKGARSENGLTVGILPGDSRSEANEYIEVPIVTGLGYARNALVVKSSQAVIAIDGEFGTLSEIAYALQDGIPVVGLNTWSLLKGGQLDSSIIKARDPVDAVQRALTAAQKRGSS